MTSMLTRLRLGGANILVVEDSPPTMEILSQLLLGFGVTRATKCGGVDEARLAVARQPFDLIIVDQDMPGGCGLSFCRHVRAQEESGNFATALILLTALPSKHTIAEARDAGAHFIIAKPVSAGVVLRRIEWIARSRRLFVTSASYRGPDRRFQNAPRSEGVEERRQDALRLMAQTERALSQDEINSLFA